MMPITRSSRGQYRSVRLHHVSFEAAPAGGSLLAACDRLCNNKPDRDAPREVIGKAWQRYVVQQDGRVDFRACTFCVLKHLQTAIHRRDVFTYPSWRYVDRRANLFSHSKWETTRPSCLPHARAAARAAVVPRQPDGGIGQNLS
jgi:hypothetical protein